MLNQFFKLKFWQHFYLKAAVSFLLNEDTLKQEGRGRRRLSRELNIAEIVILYTASTLSALLPRKNILDRGESISTLFKWKVKKASFKRLPHCWQGNSIFFAKGITTSGISRAKLLSSESRHRQIATSGDMGNWGKNWVRSVHLNFSINFSRGLPMINPQFERSADQVKISNR